MPKLTDTVCVGCSSRFQDDEIVEDAEQLDGTWHDRTASIEGKSFRCEGCLEFSHVQCAPENDSHLCRDCGRKEPSL